MMSPLNSIFLLTVILTLFPFSQYYDKQEQVDINDLWVEEPDNKIYSFEGLIPTDLTSDGKTYFKLNKEELKIVKEMKPEYIHFRIPVLSNVYHLELKKWNIFSEDIENGKEQNEIQHDGIFYSGNLINEPNTLVAVSIYDDDLSVMIRDNEKVHFVNQENSLMAYEELNITSMNETNIQNESPSNPSSSCDNPRPVRVRYSLDESLITHFSSPQLANSFVKARFNEAKVLYADIGIQIELYPSSPWLTKANRIQGNSRNTMFDNFKANHQFESSATWDVNAVVAVINKGACNGGLANAGGGCDHTALGNSKIVYPPICNKNAGSTTNDGCMPIHFIGIKTQNTINADNWNRYVFAHELGHNFGIPDSNNQDIMDDGAPSSQYFHFHPNTAKTMKTNWENCYCD